jgi:hypothetical protein
MSICNRQEPPNTACTGRLGASQCAFLGLVLSFGSFPFPSFVLPSRRLRQLLGGIRLVEVI